MRANLDEVYGQFSAIWANSRPLRSPEELAAAIRATGLDEAAVTEGWLRSLRPGWVYRDDEDPFADTRANRSYRRELGRT